jgi:hypothetical protein
MLQPERQSLFLFFSRYRSRARATAYHEYFLGLELLRPALWFYFLSESGASARHIFKRGCSGWIYAVLLIAYGSGGCFSFAWQATIQSPDLLQNAQYAVEGLLDLAQKALQDFVNLITSWLAAVRPADIDLHRPFSLLALAIVTHPLFSGWLTAITQG